jgi:HEAT repeat protein
MLLGRLGDPATLLARLPAPAQRLGMVALRRAAARWPALARLLGGAMSSSETPTSAPAEAPAPKREADAPALAEQVARLREAGDYAERARAAQALGLMTNAEATAALVAALRDRSSEVAAQAAESLARHGGPEAVTALRAVVENPDGFFNSATRASAVRALGQMLSATEATPITAAVGDVDALVSLAAIAALAERDDTFSAGALMGVLEDRRGFYLPLTRQAAARALLRLHRYDRDRLRGLLESESDVTVRDALSSLAN